MDDRSIEAFFNKNSSHKAELRISLQDSSKQGGAGVGETGKRTTWHPSSVLEGVLLIASPSELMFREISMFFEGLSSLIGAFVSTSMMTLPVRLHQNLDHRVL